MQHSYDAGDRSRRSITIRADDERAFARLALLALIFLPGTFVSSIFGMNFASSASGSVVFVMDEWYLVAILPVTTIFSICLVIVHSFMGKRTNAELHDDSLLLLVTDQNAGTYSWTKGHVIPGSTGDDNLLAVSLLGQESFGIIE